jgi:Domain of unknown function (DUF4158)
VTSIDRTAYPQFKRVITARELAGFFTPLGEEIEWARDKTLADRHLLALAVWLKSYQRLGYFPKLEEVPEAVVAHVRDALRLPGTVVPEVDAARTAKRHREFVRRRLGVKYDAAAARAIAEGAIREAAQTKDNPADLINVALDVLVKRGCELPGYSTLGEATKTIRTQVNSGFFTATAARISPAHRAGLDRLMVVDPATKRSAFDGLKAPPKAATLGKFKQRLAHLAQLDALGPTGDWLRGIPPGKIGHFAGEARVTDVADFAKIKNEAKRLTLLASLIHVLRTAARDEVTEMFCKRMATIHRKGRDRLELREEHREASERLLEVFGDVLAAAREACDTPGSQVPERTSDDIPDQGC